MGVDLDWELRDAVMHNKTEVVADLLSMGADVAIQTQDGSTILHEAAIWQGAPMVTLLLNAGAKIDLENVAGATPFTNAVFAGDLDVVKLFLDRGADPLVCNKSGQNAFDLAKKLERDEVLAVFEAWQEARNQKAIHARHIELLDKMIKPRRKSGP